MTQETMRQETMRQNGEVKTQNRAPNKILNERLDELKMFTEETFGIPLQ
jgi:hypothetical protein